MKLKYIPVFAEDADAQIDFYTQKLGFNAISNICFIEGEGCTVLQADNLDVALVVAGGNSNNTFKSCIILNTEDCLKDYHLYKTAGVFFYAAPRYLPTGLAAEFLDPGGNRFILLEERNYTEI
ncbi:VOC family protein [Mucilaginibacter lappiensis]|uniref:VOC family protein n=1 Tax=Mucilaginibacter lappiensis TaxID=354630 RepID=UPI003D23FD29